ncbi:MAG: hypothetical protein JST58_02735 [Bacteroidetes bacterium]|nr:hypothetical protein [Bacteroidota bacterium]
MRSLNRNIAFLASFVFFFSSLVVFAQDSTKNSLNITLSFYNENNKIPYLGVKVKSKIDGKFKQISSIPLALYLDADSTANLIGKVVTDDNGQAVASIPPSLKGKWSPFTKHDFIAVFDGDKKYEATKADVSIVRAKISIDTSSDKKVLATVYELQDTNWVPLKGVDVGFTIRRMDAYLNINETPTFSTDSTGQASADFKRDNIPGDLKGNIVLVAKVDDNDKYGNLTAEKIVPWGSKFVAENNFDKRTLFATRNKAPIWLLILAYSIALSVWGTLLILIVNLIKIKKLGIQQSSTH